MKTTTMNIGLYKNGTLFCIEVTDIKNEGTESIENVSVVVDVPEGVVFNSGNFPQGAYDSGTDTWNVGTLLPGANLTAMFCYEVTDSTKGDYSFIFTISSPNSCEGCDDERQFCVIVTGTSCADVASCMIEWPEVETAVYVEGNDQVYVKALVITDATTGVAYPLIDLPILTRDLVRIEGTTKYDNGGTLTMSIIPIGNTNVGATYWELGIPGAIVGAFTVRVKFYYKKQAASTN